MAELYKKIWKKKNLMKYIGDTLQVAGAIPSILTNGKANGVKATHVMTGSGLEYYVLPGRGMDIPLAFFKGKPLSFYSGTGITSPAYYEEPGLKWLRSFCVGLLTTCGISYSGAPCDDNGTLLGLHGRVANSEAENFSITQEWKEDEYCISLKGMMREASSMNEYITLKRTVESKLGSSSIKIHDVIENRGFEPQPIMMLYHINFGFPLLSPNSELIIPTLKTEARDEEAKKDRGVEECRIFGEPVNAYQEKGFFHIPVAEPNGTTMVGIVNFDTGDGTPLGLSIKYNVNQLPKLFQWKIIREGFYVCGIEPGMAYPMGRKAVRERDELIMLNGQEEYKIDLEINVFDTMVEINTFKDYVEKIVKDRFR
ncbi:hypothetical protein CVT91_02500 [Candidatus Atribacteria bacterium HGW-Atribacteria-1]|nr:MAG: hypothetical protein CVT91_02500 [Candidatus Atribacteria bacterium HGW-Atribacteria-1]